MPHYRDIEILRGRLRELAHVKETLNLLEWDQETMMPERAAQKRAETVAYLSGTWHEKFLGINHDKLLEKLYQRHREGELSLRDAALVREVWRDYERAAKLPQSFVEDFAELTSRAQGVWAKAREQNDFNAFKPLLEKIVAQSRKKAELWGAPKMPYDALLDEYEPGMIADELSATFAELRAELVPFVEAIQQAGRIKAKPLKGTFSVEEQKKFSRFLAEALGFDLAAGRIDESVHPFSASTHPYDVRITTRYSEKNPWHAISNVIHECGHAFYAQDLSGREYGTPLGEGASLGIDESLAYFWESMVGKSRHTWKYLYPKLKRHFPGQLKAYTVHDFYLHINQIQPGLIRLEADEVTQILHIQVRFELEKELLEGTIEAKHLPELWDAKMRDYLGVKVPDDARGVLQDVHWSAGIFGYFPTYTLGNLYAAQLHLAVRRDVPDFDKRLARGDFAPIRQWLKRTIHQHGRRYPPQELLRRATGERLAVAPFMEYLKAKYKALYHVS